MAKVTRRQKAVRTLEFLMGLRNPRIQSALVPFGLSTEVLTEGHQLLRQATDAQLDAELPVQQPGLTERLDVFENTWFPIAKLVLERHFPKAGQYLFRELLQTSGTDLVVSVGTFVDRYRRLESGKSPVGAAGEQAVRLLAKRGLTQEVLADVEATLAEVVQPREPLGATTSAAARERSEQAMWSWYLEWSGIARVAITDRNLLRVLGFLKSKGAKAEQEASYEYDEESEPEATAEPLAEAV